MRKRILLTARITLAAVLILLAGFCAIFWGYPETADGALQNSRVYISVQTDVSPKTSYIDFTLENHSIRRYYYNLKGLILEKKENGVWVEMERLLHQDRTMEGTPRRIKAFSGAEEKIYAPDYVLVVGLLAPGEYRVRQPMYSSRKNLANNKDPFYAIGYFTVTD